MGHLITFVISALGNLTESLGPRVGTFDCFGEVDWALIACCLKAAILKCEEWRAVVFISWMYTVLKILSHVKLSQFIIHESEI